MRKSTKRIGLQPCIRFRRMPAGPLIAVDCPFDFAYCLFHGKEDEATSASHPIRYLGGGKPGRRSDAAGDD
ncbi:MAG: hypothetical protein JW755_00945 [Candidatus Aminicenantes bacterium]|nr:hypothetical protein [Candidatus Aminicenantes bacterium]